MKNWIGPGIALLLSAVVCRAEPVAKTPTLSCKPGALGTSRVLKVGTTGGLEVGLKSYSQTLPLADHEVVLTFDDGPAATTPAVLEALRRECVKATFFLIGRNAESRPALVKQELDDGHTLGHHTYSHPAVTLRRMTLEAAEADIDRGFKADEMAAYGAAGSAPRVPFFRFPGFADSAALDGWLASRDIAVFGTDLWAMDWLDQSPRSELDYLLRRLDEKKRGIILLHDSRASTAAMLPDLLRALKAKGYRIVQLVPGAGRQETVPAPKGWTSETDRVIAEVFARQNQRKLVHVAGHQRGRRLFAYRRSSPVVIVHHLSTRHRTSGAAKRTRTSTGLPTSTSS